MDVWISSLIATLQLIKFSTISAWHPKSPLILVDTYPYTHGKVFPSMVRPSEFNTCLVYHTTENENALIVYPFCGNPDTGYRYCNSAEPFYPSQYQNQERPTTICNHEVEYDIVKSLDGMGNHETCHHNGRSGYIYQFVYRLCQPNADGMAVDAAVIYKVCYQYSDMQIIFGSYTIQKPSLLRNEFLEDEQNHRFLFDFWHVHEDFMQEIGQLLNLLFQQNNQYTPKTVLPSEWLPFAHQRKAFFNFMNVAPMENTLIQGWDVMIMNLRNKLSQVKHAINVTAGLLEVMKDKEGEYTYLYNSNSNNYREVPIAKMWWVLIYNDDKTHGVVIIMDNAPIVSQMRRTFYDSGWCNTKICRDANLFVVETYRRQFGNNMYCCYPIVITTEFHLNGGNNLLRLPNVPS